MIKMNVATEYKNLMLKGVIFDFDGTIVSIHIDFKKIREKIIKNALKHRICIPGNNLYTLELLEYVNRYNKKNIFSEKFLADTLQYLKNEELKAAEKSVPLPGCINLVKDFKRRGIKIGIITRNCRDAVEVVINKFSIPYDALLTREDVKKVKPDKEHIKTAIKLLGLRKNEVIMVGDHPMDIKCAKNFGVMSCGILSGNAHIRSSFKKEGADFILTNIEDLYCLFGIKIRQEIEK